MKKDPTKPTSEVEEEESSKAELLKNAAKSVASWVGNNLAKYGKWVFKDGIWQVGAHTVDAATELNNAVTKITDSVFGNMLSDLEPITGTDVVNLVKSLIQEAKEAFKEPENINEKYKKEKEGGQGANSNAKSGNNQNAGENKNPEQNPITNLILECINCENKGDENGKANAEKQLDEVVKQSGLTKRDLKNAKHVIKEDFNKDLKTQGFEPKGSQLEAR